MKRLIAVIFPRFLAFLALFSAISLAFPATAANPAWYDQAIEHFPDERDAVKPLPSLTPPKPPSMTAPIRPENYTQPVEILNQPRPLTNRNTYPDLNDVPPRPSPMTEADRIQLKEEMMQSNQTGRAMQQDIMSAPLVPPMGGRQQPLAERPMMPLPPRDQMPPSAGITRPPKKEPMTGVGDNEVYIGAERLKLKPPTGDGLPRTQGFVDIPRNAPPIPMAAAAPRAMPRMSYDQLMRPALVAPVERLLIATIFFPNEGKNLSKNDMDVLRKVAKIAKEQDGQLMIIGHSSSRTKTMDQMEHNLTKYKTSLERAEAVAKTLSQMGIAKSRLQASGRSDREPLYAETMPTGEAWNRRVEIYLEQ
ncbi:MAG: OmpA family protein [Dongiaceae bacterium]